jgi:hypothetical protein
MQHVRAQIADYLEHRGEEPADPYAAEPGLPPVTVCSFDAGTNPVAEVVRIVAEVGPDIHRRERELDAEFRDRGCAHSERSSGAAVLFDVGFTTVPQPHVQRVRSPHRNVAHVATLAAQSAAREPGGVALENTLDLCV